MIRSLFPCLALLGSLALPAAALDAPLPRHPAPSPDGSEILFSWQGDLWRVSSEGGDARRITAHPGMDRQPVWSRDGRHVAFAGDRQGSYDVYVMPADGSAPPRRLTHASADDRPVDFTPDGGAVLFVSRRSESFRRHTAFFTVPLEGGTPALALDALGLTAAYSPDGGTLALARGSTRWNRRGYRGAANRDLWLYENDEYRQLTDFDGDDDSPAWIDAGQLLFLSARAGRKNLFRLDLASGEATQLTGHDGSDVRSPQLSANGRLAAYEFEDGIWTVGTDGGEPRRLEIRVPADAIEDPVEHHMSREDADELALHPSGEIAALVIRGEVFLTSILSKEEQKIAPPLTIQLTSTPEREDDVSWSPDGEALLFTSDRSGGGDLYLLRRADPEVPWIETFDFPVTRLTQDPLSDADARFSPDGGRIAFTRGGSLLTIASDGSDEKVLVDHWAGPAFDWSPDGRWLAYSLSDESFNSEVWLQPADGGEPYNVSRHPDDDDGPRFTADGRRLVWESKRHSDTMDLWGVWLRREDHERTPLGWLQELRDKIKGPMGPPNGKNGKNGKSGDNSGNDRRGDQDEKGDPAGEAGSGDEPEEKPLPEVKIDFEELWARAEPMTELRGDEDDVVPGPDGLTVYFTAENADGRDLYSIAWNGEDLKRLTQGGTEPEHVQVTADGKTLFFLDQKGRAQRIDGEGKPGDPVPFAARYAVDRRLEAAAVFEEAWRALDEMFYDPKFHGIDWPAQREKYRPWVLGASHSEDFEDMMNVMLGELDASHMAYRGPRGEGPRLDTGWTGAFFDPAGGGPGILVREVLPNSPASRQDVALVAGEQLLAVGGQEIGPETNVYSLFTDTVDQRVRLRILGTDGEERTAVVIPIGDRELRQLRYEQWTRQRQAIVEEVSDGRLGYLHIQGMNIPSYEDFERDLYAAGHGKAGLVIDVRSNGGGWTTDYLMAALTVRRHARTVPRGADPEILAYPQGRLPLAAWTRPAVALCDQDSYSNAEIFSWAFQSLERGPLVGYPTFGAVISTGGTNLVNGGFVRLPFRGWYVAGSDVNMERNGAVPDVLVRLPPEQDLSAEKDAQLEKAVEVLLDSLEADPRRGAW